MHHTQEESIPAGTPAVSRHDDDHFSSNMSTISKASALSHESGRSTRVEIDQREVLRVINEYRAEHGAGPLKWSVSCAKRARSRANHCASATDEFGENLARSTSTQWSDPSVASIASIHHWQKEGAHYDYDKPGLSANTGNFTNNVWKLTTHVGFGVGKARYKGKITCFVAAAFSPKGSQPGDFRRNVLPSGSEYDGDENMVKLAPHIGCRPGSLPPQHLRVTTVHAEVGHLSSSDGRYRFQMLPDRNIVIRRLGKIIWESGSKSRHGPPVSAPFRLVLQKDGDLVGYDSSSRIFWSSNTARCGPAPYTLSMRDDGICVLYDGGWKARWATSLCSDRTDGSDR